MEWVRFVIAATFLLSGATIAAIATFGIHKFRFVLNRMHAAALCDTFAMLLVLTGLIVLWGISFEALKLLLIIIFLWFASPVSSHLLARMEVTINDHLKDDCEIPEAVEETIKEEEERL